MENLLKIGTFSSVIKEKENRFKQNHLHTNTWKIKHTE